MPDLPRPCLMILTDRTLLTPNWTLSQAIAPAVTGGANFVLYRESDLPPVPRASVFRFLRDGVRRRVPLVVEGTPEWALGIAADGVHIDNTVVTNAEAREKLGFDRWVGRTVTTLDQVSGVKGPDYVLIHLDWNEPASALQIVSRFACASSAPVVVGPDVPLEHAAACLSAGAAGIGIVHAAMAAYDRTSAVRAYAEALEIHNT